MDKSRRIEQLIAVWIFFFLFLWIFSSPIWAKLNFEIQKMITANHFHLNSEIELEEQMTRFVAFLCPFELLNGHTIEV